MSQLAKPRPAVARQPRFGGHLAASHAVLALAVAAGVTVWAAPAAADTLIIKRPGYHPRYSFEAEPHLLLGFVDPPGNASGNGVGLGFRGTVKLLENGFVPSINNNVGVGFGIDFVHYGSSRCVRFNLAGYCQASDAVDDVWIPVVLQWNFFLSRNWSVFGEPGIALRYESWDGPGKKVHFEPLQLFVGGRFHFTDNITLTMRVGYPTFSLGVSFLI